MDILGVIFFILFIIVRFLTDSAKQGQGRPPVPTPQKPDQEPWWEEPKPKTVEIKQKPGNVDKQGKIVQKEKSKKNVPAKENFSLSQNEAIFPGEIDIDEVRRGIIWAEILEPPKAKRKKYY